jgi:regulatory protein
MDKDCRETALRFLEHREKSTFEVRSHLIIKGFLEEEIEKELQFLTELRYLDDERYCSDYVRYGISKGRGPVRLQHELSEKGIDSALIRDALEVTFDRNTEREAAMQEARKLLKQVSEMDEKNLAKVGRKLHSLGYHSDVIYDLLGKLRKS